MKGKNKILIVDDSIMNRTLLSDMLANDYEIIEACDGIEAITQLNQYHLEISLVLLDIVMPRMDGFEVLAAMNKSGWIGHIPVITISSEISSSYIDHAYDLGAEEYISRPFDEKTVLRRVKNTIILYSKQKNLENMVTQQMIEKEKNTLMMVDILSHIVEFRNGESGLHVLHIRIITDVLLRELAKMTDQYHLTPSRISLITNASALHDIGKISIPESILNKPGKLTDEEYEIMKTHSVVGAEMLEKTPYHQKEELLKTARDICLWHHERYDGRGYPDGLIGEEIPIASQVVSLADVYDALTSKRVYKPAYSHEKSLQMIFDGECGVFNPLLLECLEKVSGYLQEQLKIHSNTAFLESGLQYIPREIFEGKNVSNSAVLLLELEKTKSHFFSSLSKEIQFEYDYQSDVLKLSEWGAKALGVDTVVAYPLKDTRLNKMFEERDISLLHQELENATPQQPIVSTIFRTRQKHTYRMIARPLWMDEETQEKTAVIGKIIDMNEERK